MGSGITCVFYKTYIFQLYIISLKRENLIHLTLFKEVNLMAAIRQKLDKAFMEGKISNKDRFEFLDLIESGKLSKVELAKELMFLHLIDVMPA